MCAANYITLDTHILHMTKDGDTAPQRRGAKTSKHRKQSHHNPCASELSEIPFHTFSLTFFIFFYFVTHILLLYNPVSGDPYAWQIFNDPHISSVQTQHTYAIVYSKACALWHVGTFGFAFFASASHPESLAHAWRPALVLLLACWHVHTHVARSDIRMM